MEREDYNRQLEKMRGQMEEMRGRLEQLMGREYTGRTHEMRGRSRQAMAEMRGTTEGFGEEMTGKTGLTFGLGTLGFLGLSVLALAIFSPRTFRRIIDRFFDLLGF